MIIPDLNNVKALKCVKSDVKWWTVGKNYHFVGGYITEDESKFKYGELDDISMDFEIIYHDEKPDSSQVKNPSHYDFYGGNC